MTILSHFFKEGQLHCLSLVNLHSGLASVGFVKIFHPVLPCHFSVLRRWMLRPCAELQWGDFREPKSRPFPGLRQMPKGDPQLPTTRGSQARGYIGSRFNGSSWMMSAMARLWEVTEEVALQGSESDTDGEWRVPRFHCWHAGWAGAARQVTLGGISGVKT